MKTKINNNELKSIFFDKAVLQRAGKLAKTLLKARKYDKAQILAIYQTLAQMPDKYQDDETFGEIATMLMRQQAVPTEEIPNLQLADLKSVPLPYEIFGAEYIDVSAQEQMNIAMKLPVAVAGALMPDAHQGYGLPIGGVLATIENAVIPYAVGVDIACRMCLSVFDIEASYLEQKQDHLKKYLIENTIFGIGEKNKNPLPDDIWDKPEWKATAFIKSLLPKAMSQIGTSGTGNHFVEWGVLEIIEENSPDLKFLPKGKYLALLSHSGSRGFGASVANHYSKIAMQKVKLPKQAQHLAWLELNSEEGEEYWIAMNLAGDYASANHRQIHKRMARALGVEPILMIENHHNFAWKETLPDGRKVVVHRKGATPAQKGVLGIIPGSMASPGFVIRGKGSASSLNSASHGAGRLMSRNKAYQTFSIAEIKQFLKSKNVVLIGGDLDEAPMVYKDIYQIMQVQQDLVEILAKFIPRIVRMADPEQNRQGRED